MDSDIIDNSALWQVLAGAGGRLNEDADAPYYYGTNFTARLCASLLLSWF
jgi:hypothetical protein